MTSISGYGLTLGQFWTNTVSDGYDGAAGAVDRYAPVPETNGIIDYTTITPALAAETGVSPFCVRLTNGWHRHPKNGCGILHIMEQHGPQMARLDYHSVQDFVREVGLYFDRVYRSETGRWMLVLTPDVQVNYYRVLVVESQPIVKCYSVVTGYLREGNRKMNGTLVWERRDRSAGSGLPGPP